MTTTTTADGTTTIEAPADLPVILMTRDFAATPAQLVKAHTDEKLFAQWTGPQGTEVRIEHWDPRSGGSWRYVTVDRTGEEYGFHGCFHTVRDDRLVQTFTFEGIPDSIALESMWFEQLDDGRTRLRTQSLFDSYEARDGMLSSGMDVGVNDGYARLDGLLAAGAV